MRPLHEPHAPFLQPYGRPTPFRNAAARTVSSSSTSKRLPLGCAVTVNVILGRVSDPQETTEATPDAMPGTSRSIDDLRRGDATTGHAGRFAGPRILIVGCGDV